MTKNCHTDYSNSASNFRQHLAPLGSQLSKSCAKYFVDIMLGILFAVSDCRIFLRTTKSC
jgi:hypothetical protein